MFFVRRTTEETKGTLQTNSTKRMVLLMPRQPRLDSPGVLHHVMARGIERRMIFTDDKDRNDFIFRLSVLAEARNFMVYAWTLMPNHFHLLVRTGNRSLSGNMRALLTGYAGYYNRRHRRHGHLFQNRFKSIVCDEENYFLELVRYLHLNPLRAGIVKDIKGLDRYQFTGHSSLMGQIERPWQERNEVLDRFSGSRKKAKKKYRVFVSGGVDQGRRPELMGGGLVRSVGGWDRVAELRQGREVYQSDERILGSSDFVESLIRKMEKQEGTKAKKREVSLEKLKEQICADLKVTVEALESGSRISSVSQARAVLCHLWICHLGRSGRQLASELGVSPQAVYSASARIELVGGVSAEDLARWCIS